jgi:hypothetical protein
MSWARTIFDIDDVFNDIAACNFRCGIHDSDVDDVHDYRTFKKAMLMMAMMIVYP